MVPRTNNGHDGEGDVPNQEHLICDLPEVVDGQGDEQTEGESADDAPVPVRLLGRQGYVVGFDHDAQPQEGV